MQIGMSRHLAIWRGYEASTASCWNPQGSVPSHLGWEKEGLVSVRAALRGMGDLPPQRITKSTPIASMPRLYASQTSGWFGQVVQRSDDGGVTWNAVRKQVHLPRRSRNTSMV
jgi:hypothetical protein